MNILNKKKLTNFKLLRQISSNLVIFLRFLISLRGATIVITFNPSTGKLATPVAPTRSEADTFTMKVGTDRPEANFHSACRVFY